MIYYQRLILDKIISLPHLQLIKYRTAYLQSRWGRDSVNLAIFYGDHLFNLVKNGLIIVLGMVAAISLSPLFSFIVAIFVALMSASIYLSSKYLVRHLKNYMEKVATLSGKVNETIAGIYELKIMGFFKYFRSGIYRDISATANQNYRIMFRTFLLLAGVNALISLGFFGALIYFGFLLVSHKISIGDAIAFMGISFFIMKSLTGFFGSINKINNILASLKLTSELLNAPVADAEIPEELDEHRKIDPVDSIRFKDVWFKYEGGKDYVIKNFSYTIEKGKFYALTGRSGIGKTTLINLLLGVIPAERGEVLINDVVRTSADIHYFWERIGYMSQEPFLFKGDLMDNLLPGNDQNASIDAETLRKALDESGLEKFDPSAGIEVEEAGKNFSGGERRRIALARAFLKDADVLILDEPTSQVDDETAHILVESIHRFTRRGKIAIMIAHSEKAIKRADVEIRLGEMALSSPENRELKRKKLAGFSIPM
ncbi:MAG: ABC transporter ATP-binding protein [bacterium]|nr:ABC transporter ATP-binding protein [bacterium]